MPKQKQHRHPATPTQQDFDQDRFYYNNEEDFREVLSEVCNQAANLRGMWYDLGSDEEQRVSKFW